MSTFDKNNSFGVAACNVFCVHFLNKENWSNE